MLLCGGGGGRFVVLSATVGTTLFFRMCGALSSVFRGPELTRQRLVEASGEVTQLACEIRSKRAIARTLCFLEVCPVDAEEWRVRGWRSEAKVQLIVGASLERSVGADRCALAIRRARPGQRLLVEAKPSAWNATTIFPRWLSRQGRQELAAMRRQRRAGQLDLNCLSVRVLSTSTATTTTTTTKTEEEEAFVYDENSPPRRRQRRQMVMTADEEESRLRRARRNSLLIDSFFRLPKDVSVVHVFNDETALPLLAAAEQLTEGDVVGIDTEWEGDASAALVQVAVGRRVFVADMTTQSTIVDEALGLIRIRGTLVGFGIAADLAKVGWEDHENYVELKRHSRQSLSDLAKEVLGLPLDKSLQCFRWQSTRPLPSLCIDYAALDAYVPLACYLRMRSQKSFSSKKTLFRETAKKKNVTLTARKKKDDFSFLDEKILDKKEISAKSIFFSSTTVLTVGTRALRGETRQHTKDAALSALLGGNETNAVTGYDRRAGLVRIADASVFFVTFTERYAENRKYPNSLTLDDDAGDIRLNWWPPANVRVEERFRAKEACVLFARLGAKADFFLCGHLSFLGPIPGDANGGMVLGLTDTPALLARRLHDPNLDRLLTVAGLPPENDLQRLALLSSTSSSKQ